MDRTKFFIWICAAFAFEWILLAVNVYNRQDWALENALVVIALYPIYYCYYKKGYLSKISLFFLFLFLSLHCVGAHYTYSLVPYDQWLADLIGVSINKLLHWDRNNYDRILHFLFGVLVFNPIYEIFHGSTKLKRSHLVAFTFLILFGASTLYELVEWGAASIFGGDLGVAYVGAQGDPWDAQKDQACAALGSGLGLLISIVLRRRRI